MQKGNGHYHQIWCNRNLISSLIGSISCKNVNVSEIDLKRQRADELRKHDKPKHTKDKTLWRKSTKHGQKKTRGRNSDTSRGRDLHVSKHATLVGVLGVDG